MSGQLKLNFYDASFERVSDHMQIRLEHTVLHKVYEVRKQVRTVRIDSVDTDQGGRYLLWVNPDRYRSMFRIVQVKDGQRTEEHIVLAIRPGSVREVKFPEFQELTVDLTRVLSVSSIESFPGLKGQPLFDTMRIDPVRTAGLFNLHAKMNATVFRNGRSVFSYIDALTRIRGDRIFAAVQKDLRDEVKNAAVDEAFSEVSGSLHTPPPNYQLVDSFKTPEPYGNLQLTFFCRIDAIEFLIDADIDDAGGIGHIFQVIEHRIGDSETHPYDIHQILSYYQRIHPGYELIV